MDLDFSWPSGLAADIQFGLVDSVTPAPQRHNPAVVVNGDQGTMLEVLREQLRHSEYFDFSVAFVTTNAIATLKQSFLDFQGTGRITTSDYLRFNSPEAFAELLNLRRSGIDIRVHPATGFHPKGYIFLSEDAWTVIIGSSNLTLQALTSNVEWNLKVSAARASDLARQVENLSRQQLENSIELEQSWIDAYAAEFDADRIARAATRILTPSVGRDVERIVPNKMQTKALEEIQRARDSGADKAIIISATGTGKTILSALDVREVDPRRMLFVVHREQIIDKTISEYQKVLAGDLSQYGKLVGPRRETDRKYVFATVQSLSRPENLYSLSADHFDYIIYDEAHRAGSRTHQQILDHFRPKFALGMTATPERTDGFNVYELFDHNVPYEIRLNDALEAEMLCPFHYYGVADLDEARSDHRPTLTFLTSEERVDYVLDKIDTYAQAGVPPKGLIYCSRNEEAERLAEMLNERTLRGRRLRTVALSGADSIDFRNEVVGRLERGELDYVLTVDIFNEGIDIPAVNQVIMLRQTQSVIVFVQQLGRGLRKHDDKEHLVVLDFIGNYANNFMIPIALFGDASLNKESLRKNLIAAEERGVVAGSSSVQFDRIAQTRVLEAISSARLDSLQMLREAVVQMRDRLGKTPRLSDFHRFESVDPVLLATKKSNYAELLRATVKHESSLTPDEHRMLALLSNEMFTAKRLHEFVVFRQLIDQGRSTVQELIEKCKESGLQHDRETILSAIDTFTLDNHAQVDRRRYGRPFVSRIGDVVTFEDEFLEAYSSNDEFEEHVVDLVATGQRMVVDRFDHTKRFTPGSQYSRKEVTRLLNWPRAWTSTLYGYKADKESGFCPIFVTLHKADDISESTAYEDELLDTHTLRWFTRSRRTLESDEVRAIISDEVEPHVFVKKDDAEGTEFYYLGRAFAKDPVQTTMKGGEGQDLDVVTMSLDFEQPIEHSLYNYFHPVITG